MWGQRGHSPPANDPASRGKSGRDVNLIDNLKLGQVAHAVAGTLAGTRLVWPEANGLGAVLALVRLFADRLEGWAIHPP